MKTTAKSFWLPVQLLILLAFLLPRPLLAQGTLNALTIDPGSGTAGYALQGIGWSFVPSADLSVTAISSTASQVNFWLGTNQVIASYNYAGPFSAPPPFQAPTNFQGVSSLLLLAGQTYFISTQQPNFASAFTVFVYGLNQSGSPYGPITFSPSPYISQFASYYLSSSGQWSSTGSPGYNNSDYALLGPNFQFQVVPEPTSFQFSILVVGVMLFRNRISSVLFHGRKTH